MVKTPRVPKPRKPTAGKGPLGIVSASGPAATGTINAWEDDPQTGVIATRPVPNMAAPLAYIIATDDKPGPAGIYPSGTPDFRYWTAAEALRRCADFWSPRVPGGKWEVGEVLNVVLNDGDQFNAYYDRGNGGLFFYQCQGPSGLVYTGESPDIVCHEMGHAVLDSLKPQLFDAASQEASAFHESFGDISAILSALQLDTLRAAVLSDTNFDVSRNSRLSRLAEQFGAALRVINPDAAEPDCLRNAVNSFVYVDPITLPHDGPVTQLTSEFHSFSRVFTGAAFEIIGGLLKSKAAVPGRPTSAELLAVTAEFADMLVAAIAKAPVVSNFYSQVAAAMVETAASYSPASVSVVRSAFVRRAILSLGSAWSVQNAQKSLAAMAPTLAASQPDPQLAKIALPASNYGFNAPIIVDAASHARSFIARAADVRGIGAVEPANSSTAAVAFLNDLFSRDHVDCSTLPDAPKGFYGRSSRSHEVVEENGAFRLRRCHFNCGFSR